LQALKPNLCRAILRYWIREQGFLMPDSKHLERIRCELMPAALDRSPLVAWSGTEVRRYRDDIFLLTPLVPPPAPIPIRWLAGQNCDLPEGLGYLRQIQTQEAGIDPISWSQGHIEVRFGMKGLQCQPAKKAHKRRLKDIYQQHSIPDWLRSYIPLVYLDGELIAVAGICLCHQHTNNIAPLIRGVRGFRTHIVEQQGIKIVWEAAPNPFQWLTKLT
jgi:tRNA(Ile)-lysidine synthase